MHEDLKNISMKIQNQRSEFLSKMYDICIITLVFITSFGFYGINLLSLLMFLVTLFLIIYKKYVIENASTLYYRYIRNR